MKTSITGKIKYFFTSSKGSEGRGTQVGTESRPWWRRKSAFNVGTLQMIGAPLATTSPGPHKRGAKKQHTTRFYAGSQKFCSQLFDLFLKTADQKMCCHKKDILVHLLQDIACLADTSLQWVRTRAGFPLFVFWRANAVYSVLAVCDREAEEFSLQDIKFYLVRWTPPVCVC